MSITKPFTFVAGTKARANEVNQNFDVLYSQVNSNISAINTNANDINTLDSNKANVNGSSSQRFACADPTSPSDAVNKQSLTKAIGNSVNYIDGYIISRDYGSPNNTILVTAGCCYDSTRTVILSKNTSTSKQNSTQGGNTVYYIYVIGNDTGSSVDILISTNAVNPTLPSGYTVFRQIGYYTTDTYNNIYVIQNQSNSMSVNNILSMAMPDYARRISVSMTGHVGYTAWCPCIFTVSCNNDIYSTYNSDLYVNDFIYARVYKQDGYNQYPSITVLLDKGDTVTWDNVPTAIVSQYIIPLKGAN